MIIEFLGTGTSHGIPMVGCSCPVCTSTDSRDQRYRSSILIRGRADECAIVDTGPEFRLQAIRSRINHLDSVFLTHAHADHLHGLDDVRPLSFHKPLRVYGNKPTIHEMMERFSYVFKETQIGGGKPRLIPTVLGNDDSDQYDHAVSVGNLCFTPLPVFHGNLQILGWLMEEKGHSLAYITDASEIPKETLALLGNLDVLVIGALRKRPHPTHFSFDQALEVARMVQPRKTLLTHLCHDFSHEEICTYIQEQGFSLDRVAPAYDGLTLDL